MTVLPDAVGWQPALIQVGTLPMKPDLLAPDGELEGMVDVPSNVLLLRGHGMTVLVDAGSGPYVGMWEGATEDLEGALAAAGCRFEDVDLLVMTHLDFDHAGGCCEFPRARMAVPEGSVAGGHGGDPGQQALDHFGAAGRLDWVPDGGSPAPGLVVRAAPGHREGHSVVEVGDTLIHIADVVHHPLQVANPGWDHVFDSDPATARSTRRIEIKHASFEEKTVVSSHISGAGRIVQMNESAWPFGWAPL